MILNQNDINNFLEFIKNNGNDFGNDVYSHIKNYFEDIAKQRKNKSEELKRLRKEKAKGIVITKPCPQCGCNMERTHALKDKNGRVCYYRRWSCTSCNHYESHVAKKSDNPEKQEISILEFDKLQNEKHNKYFPKDKKLIMKQGFNLNNKDL